MKLAPRALLSACAVGTVLQLLMVTVGHSSAAVKQLYAPLGMGLSFATGILYAVISTEVLSRDLMAGGAIAGSVCAFIGIAVACAMHDVAAFVLVVGTLTSAVAGAVGGWVGRLFLSGRA